MGNDTPEELERIEKELLTEDETQVLPEVFFENALDDEDLTKPAFEDATEIHDTEEPLVYCNYSNDYGRETQEQEKAAQRRAKKDEAWTTGMMFLVSGLCLGIIGVLIYWLVAWL